MADLNPTDLLLVNRNDTTQKVTQATIMAELLDTDYMVLQRSDNTYKITGLDFKNSMVDPLEVTVTLTPIQPQVDVQETAIVDIAGGKDPYTTTYQWRLKDSGGTESDIAGATDQTYTPVEANVGSSLACVASVTDDYGNTASAASAWSLPILSAQSAPVIGSATLTETGDGSARFTSQTFGVDVAMSEEGVPAPEYGLKGYVEGTLETKATTDEITDVAAGPGQDYSSKFSPVSITLSEPTSSAFDGNPATYAMGATTAVDGGWTISQANLQALGLDSGIVSLRVEVFWQTDLYIDVNGTQVRGSDTGKQWIDCTAALLASSTPDGLTSFGIQQGLSPMNIQWYQVEVNGSVLVDGEPTTVLTLASDQDLATFSPGDAVVSEPTTVRAQTSEIVGVSSTPVVTLFQPTDFTSTTGYQGNLNPENYFNGTNATIRANEPWSTSNYIKVIWPAGATGGVFSFSTGFGGCVYQWINTDGSDGPTVTQNPSNLEFSETLSASYSELRVFGTNTTGGYPYMGDIKFNGVLIQDGYGETNTTLTFANNNQLTNFAADDLVQQNAPLVAPGVGYSATLYTGNQNGLGQTVNTGVNVSDNGGLVWVKEISSSTTPYYLFDTNRGPLNSLSCNTSDLQETLSNSLESFLPDGFYSGSGAYLNDEGHNYSAWSFVNATKFFEALTYVGDGANGRQVPHSLNATPGFIITKCMDGSSPSWWYCYHSALGNAAALALNSHNESSSYSDSLWNQTSPTDTYFVLGGTGYDVNQPGLNYAAYLFAEDETYVKCASYSNATTLTQIVTGFNIGWLLIKNVDQGTDWMMFDNKTGAGNPVENPYPLNPNSTTQPDTQNYIKFIENGFEIQANNATISGNYTFVYIAVAADATPDMSVLPAGIFQSADPAGPTMELRQQIAGWSANTGNSAVGPLLSGGGVVASTDVANDKMTLSSVTGRWLANAGQKATTTSEVEVAKLYTVLSSSGQVIDLVANDPGYTTMAGNPSYTMTFPAVFPSGEAPDEDLPNGTSLTVDVGAANIAGSSFVTSNTVVPVDAVGIEGQFATTLYTGTGATQNITSNVDLVNQNGLVWIKVTDYDDPHFLTDTVRGNDSNLLSNDTGVAQTVGNRITAFLDNGFTLGDNANTNGDGLEFVSWTFQKKAKFFDVVEYTGDNSSNQTISHNLNSVPGFIITKAIDASTAWYCYHSALGASKFIELNQPNAANTNTATWNNTAPTSSTFTVGDSGTNGVADYISYLFADDEEYIKCGTFNGSSSYPNSIFVGFEPQWLLFKTSNEQQDWYLFDSARDTSTDSPSLSPNTAAGNNNFGEMKVTFTATGFDLNNFGGDGQEYIYVAIKAPDRESSLGNFSSEIYTGGSGTTLTVINGIDLSPASGNNGLVWTKCISANWDWAVVDTVRGGTSLLASNLKDAASINTNYPYVTNFGNGSYTVGSNSTLNVNTENYNSWTFLEKAKFFDIVEYTGSGTSGLRQLNHNLETKPGFIIIKNLTEGDSQNGWHCWHKDLNTTRDLLLDTEDPVSTFAEVVWSTSDTQFGVSNMTYSNNNNSEYIAYLFAGDGDFIKCGEYIGQAGGTSVYCGFQPQWVLIKNTGTSDNWILMDAQNPSQALYPNSNSSNEPASYLTFTSTGFTVSQTGKVGDEDNTYIYMAIAAPYPTSTFSADSAKQLAAFNALKSTFGAYEQQVIDRIANITSVLIAGGYSYNELPHIHGCGEDH